MTTPTTTNGHTIPETPAGGLTAAEWTEVWRAAGNGVSRLGDAARVIDRIIADRVAAAVVQARAEEGNRREWHHGCYSFAEVEQAVAKAHAEDQARIEAALAVLHESDVTRPRLSDDREAILADKVRAALTATEDGDRT